MPSVDPENMLSEKVVLRDVNVIFGSYGLSSCSQLKPPFTHASVSEVEAGPSARVYFGIRICISVIIFDSG